MIRHIDTNGIGFEEAAEVFLVFDGPITVAGAEAPGGIRAALLGLGFDVRFEFIGELFGEGGRGGVEEEAADVLIFLKAGVARFLNRVSDGDGECCDGERVSQVISDGGAAKGEGIFSIAEDACFQFVGEKLPDAARRGERSGFGGGFSDGGFREIFFPWDAGVAQHFFFVDGKEGAMVERHTVSFLFKNLIYYII